MAAPDLPRRTIQISHCLVLVLWTAAVAKVQHPDLSWKHCLDAGSLVQQNIEIVWGKKPAQLRGRMIGALARKAAESAARQGMVRNPQRPDCVDFWLMGERMTLDTRANRMSKSDARFRVSEEDYVLFEDRESPGWTRDWGYEDLKDAMLSAAGWWANDKEALSEMAWRLYEGFKPETHKAGDAWKRPDAVLDLDRVKWCVQLKTWCEGGKWRWLSRYRPDY